MIDDDAPRTIGRYEVLRAIGEGGMAHVWLARDPALGREVAIKVVKLRGLPQATQDNFIERFKNEARAVAMLKHASIVAVHDTGVDEGLGVYSVYEFVPGESLRERLDGAGGELPLDEAARIVRAVGDALQAAHDVGIVHRDVKPANILLAADGSVKLADFGVARLPDAAMTREGTFLGTPSYAAPEALKKGVFGAASDVWAFGVVAYETVAGQHPFPGDDMEAVANQVLHSTITPPVEVRPRIGRAASDAIMRALDRDPDRRASSASVGRAIADALENAPRSGGARRWIGIAAALVTIVAGTIAVRAVTGSESTSTDGTDAGVLAPEPTPPPRRNGPPRPALPVDRAPTKVTPQAPDASVAEPPAPLDPRSEEDRIKDLLARARRLKVAGDLDGARAAVQEVLRIDAAHPEARRLLDEL